MPIDNPCRSPLESSEIAGFVHTTDIVLGGPRINVVQVLEFSADEPRSARLCSTPAKCIPSRGMFEAGPIHGQVGNSDHTRHP